MSVPALSLIAESTSAAVFSSSMPSRVSSCRSGFTRDSSYIAIVVAPILGSRASSGETMIAAGGGRGSPLGGLDGRGLDRGGDAGGATGSGRRRGGASRRQRARAARRERRLGLLARARQPLRAAPLDPGRAPAPPRRPAGRGDRRRRADRVRGVPRPDPEADPRLPRPERPRRRDRRDRLLVGLPPRDRRRRRDGRAQARAVRDAGRRADRADLLRERGRARRPLLPLLRRQPLLQEPARRRRRARR